MNNYAKYIKERENKELLEFEHGFIAYQLLDKELFLCDMFILKEHRGSNAVSIYISELLKIAKENKCNHISANVDLRDKGANRTINAAFKLDFKLIAANNNIITIIKEVK